MVRSPSGARPLQLRVLEPPQSSQSKLSSSLRLREPSLETRSRPDEHCVGPAAGRCSKVHEVFQGWQQPPEAKVAPGGLQT